MDRPKSSASVETEGFSAGGLEKSGGTGKVGSTGDPMGRGKGKIKEALVVRHDTRQARYKAHQPECADLGANHFRNCFVILQLKSEVLTSLSLPATGLKTQIRPRSSTAQKRESPSWKAQILRPDLIGR